MDKFFYKSYRFFFRAERARERRVLKIGIFLWILILVTSLIGLDTVHSLVYQVFSFLISFLVVSFISSKFFIKKFSAKRVFPEIGTVGEKLVYQIVLKNETGKKQKGLTIKDYLKDPRPTFNQFLNFREPYEHKRNFWDRYVKYHRWKWIIKYNEKFKNIEHKVPDLTPSGSTTIWMELTPKKRGKLVVDQLTVLASDPFGVYRSYMNIDIKDSALIFPKMYQIPQFIVEGLKKYQPGGVALASSLGNSDQFFSLREYRAGDPWKYIHWKSWAKKQKPIVREFQDEYFVRHALILDTFLKNKNPDIFEEGVSVSSSLLLSLSSIESLLDLIFIGDKKFHFSSGGGGKEIEHLLEILASVEISDKEFDQLVMAVEPFLPSLSSAICVFVDWDDKRRLFVDKLKQFNIEVIIFLIIDKDVDKNIEIKHENSYILPIDSIKETLDSI